MLALSFPLFSCSSKQIPAFESSLISGWKAFERYDLIGAQGYFEDALAEATVLQLPKAQGEALAGLSLVLLLQHMPTWKKYFLSSLKFIARGGYDPFSVSVVVLVAAEAGKDEIPVSQGELASFVEKMPDGDLKTLTEARLKRAFGKYREALVLLDSLESHIEDGSDYLKESAYREKSKIYSAMLGIEGTNTTEVESLKKLALDYARKALKIASRLKSRYRVIENLLLLYDLTGEEAYRDQLKWLGVDL